MGAGNLWRDVPRAKWKEIIGTFSSINVLQDCPTR